MRKRNHHPRSLAASPRNKAPMRRNIPVDDLFLYARSFHKAAKALAGSVELDGNPVSTLISRRSSSCTGTHWSFTSRRIVLGEGGNFLATKPDPLSIQKTDSVSWLTQFVCQIVTALKWEDEFKCEGIGSLDDFKAAVVEVNSVDPGSYSFHLPVTTEAQDAARDQAKPNIRDFAHRMDALLDLLKRYG